MKIGLNRVTVANWGVTTKRVFRHASCLRYLICACINLKNKSRSTFNDRFIAATMWRRRRRRRRRRQSFIVFFVCFLRPFLPRFCAALCFVLNIGRSTLACRVYTRILQLRPAQFAVIYFISRLQLKSLIAARDFAILSLFIFLSQMTSRLYYVRLADRVKIVVRSRFRISFFPSLSHISTVNNAYANSQWYFLSRYFLVTHDRKKYVWKKRVNLSCA